MRQQLPLMPHVRMLSVPLIKDVTLEELRHLHSECLPMGASSFGATAQLLLPPLLSGEGIPAEDLMLTVSLTRREEVRSTLGTPAALHTMLLDWVWVHGSARAACVRQSDRGCTLLQQRSTMLAGSQCHDPKASPETMAALRR